MAIEVSRSLAGHGAVRRAVIRNVALTGLAVALASALVTTVLSLALIGRPLSELLAQARRVGAGDLSYRIVTRRRDEVAAVAEEMNRMCERLRESKECERAEAEARMQALAQLRHADRLATVGRLGAGLAHELGTPLNVIQARARQMTAALSPEQVADWARIIAEQAERMTKLIRQLLDFARKSEPKPVDVDLCDVIGRAVRLLRPLAQRRSVSLEVTGEDAPLRCHVDPEQITQVVTNLVMNALQASAPGTTVVIASGRGRGVLPPEDGRGEQPCARLEVRDQGTGIAADALPRLFDPFFTTKDVGEGTGLGLCVAYGIVKDHGGWIDVASLPGKGSTFTVWLPTGSRV